jgi:hypothetical protein
LILSGNRFGGASGAPFVADGLKKGTIALLVAALVGLTTFFFLSGGSGVAHATDDRDAAKGKHYKCYSEAWVFVVTEVHEDKAPDHIRVKWANDERGKAELYKYDEEHHAAWYATNANLDSKVVRVKAEIDGDWKGKVKLVAGPCHGPKPSPSGTETTHTSSPEPSESETTHTSSPEPSKSETSHTAAPAPSGTPTHEASPSETETSAPYPTSVPAGSDGSGVGPAAGILGVVLVAAGAVIGGAARTRRRFLHES